MVCPQCGGDLATCGHLQQPSSAPDVAEMHRRLMLGDGQLIEQLRIYLEHRIRFNSGHGLSSRDEEMCDRRVVQELEDALDVLNGRRPSRAEGNRP